MILLFIFFLKKRIRSVVVWNDENSTPPPPQMLWDADNTPPCKATGELHLVGLSIELGPLQSLPLTQLGDEGWKGLLHQQKPHSLR